MIEIFTMGFTKKSAEEFFTIINKNKIDIVIDVRLNNQSQLAGFTKGKDLAYFLDKICKCKYSHETMFAPEKTLLDNYKRKSINWFDYEKEYCTLIKKRNVSEIFKENYSCYNRVLLLCSEPTSDNCHRRLLADHLSAENGYPIKHI